jgi:NitT/TauT family transport system substrate-binding protein
VSRLADMASPEARLVWAERIKPMPLDPGSIPTLAGDMGMFSRAGVDLTIEEFLGSPDAMAAFRSGEAQIAHLQLPEAIKLAAEADPPAKVFWASRMGKMAGMLVSTSSIWGVDELRGKRFGIGAEGDFWDPIISKMLSSNGIERNEIRWVKGLDPSERADLLLNGKIDATFVTMQTYMSKLAGKGEIRVLLDDEAMKEFVMRSEFLVAVASDALIGESPDSLSAITKTLMRAARLFSEDSESWVEAASKRRPDVSRESIRRQWQYFQRDWPVNGDIDTKRFRLIFQKLKSEGGIAKSGELPIDRWVTTKFEELALKELGVHPS